jgi:hypothetical protein
MPSEYSLEKNQFAWWRWIPWVENPTKQMMFFIPSEDIKNQIISYKEVDGKYKEDIRGILSFLNDEEVKSYTESSTYEDMWYGLDSYSKRRIEQYNELYFKIYREVEYPYSWSVLKKFPESNVLIPNIASDFWVAHCLEGASNRTTSKKHITCRSHIVVNDLLIEFNVSEQNLEQIENIKKYLVKEVNSWISKN